jgi:hypothetical protein
MVRVIAVAAVGIVVLLGCSAASDEETITSEISEPTSTTASAVEADTTSGGYPLGLDAMNMPSEASELTSAFENMPGEFGGVPWEPTEFGHGVVYGEVGYVYGTRFRPEDLAGVGGSFAEMFAEMMSSFEASNEAATVASQFDPGVGLLWWFGTYNDEEAGFGFADVALWAEPDGEYLFSAGAETPARRDDLVVAFVEAAAVEPITTAERAASMACEDLYRFWWWPEDSLDEFGRGIDEFFPSPGTQAIIDEAQNAALAIEDTEEAWLEATIVTWRDNEPGTFYATCDLFTDGQRTVLAELGAGSAQYCIGSFYTAGDGVDQAVRDLGIADPPRDEHGTIDEVAWVRLSPNDLIAVCRRLGY